MSSLNGQRCKSGHMHDGVFLPGVGDIRKELVVGSTGERQVKSLVIQEPFVVVTLYSTTTRRDYIMPVPISNFKYLVLSETVLPTPPPKE